MKKITEISRRSLYHEDEGVACGPFSITAITAEIVLDVDGSPVHLYGEWTDVGGDYSFEATTECLFDAIEKMTQTVDKDEERAALAEIERIRLGSVSDAAFEPYYAQLEQMIHDEMDAHGVSYFYEDDEDED